jgi:hypothetical protein
MPHLASDYVWALVSGLPRRERERRRIMVLQAAIDDSGSDLQSFAFILAGFVATPAQWAKCTDAWVAVLNKTPQLDYFKNHEAMGLSGQFDKKRGWTEQKRDNRLVELAHVIAEHIPERFSVAMRHSDYRKYIHGIPTEKRVKNLENPYFLLFHEFMLVTASVHSVSKDVNPCEFVFDDQGKIGKRAAAWWPVFRKSMQTAAKFDFSPYFTASEPMFKKDHEFRPLQAADLHAGQIRLAMRSDKIFIPPSPSLRILMPISGYHRVLDHNYFAPMRNRFMSMARRIEAKSPGTLRFVLGKPTRKRKADEAI